MNSLNNGWMVLSDQFYFPVTEGENRNVLIVGTSGCGKSMSVVEPCILGNVGSMVIVDPKGGLQRKYASKLRKDGFNVFCMDLANPANSDIGFNPLNDIRSDIDVVSLANMIIYANQTGKYGSHVDPYWDQQATELLCIILDLVLKYEKNGRGDLSYVNKYLGELRTEDGESEFERRLHRIPADSFSNKLYMRFKKVFSAEKTTACIYSSLENAIGRWSCKEVEAFFQKESFDITRLAITPTVVFVKISDSDESFYPLCTFVMNYYIDKLFKYADKQDDGLCRVPVQFILDDYSSNIVIKGFPHYISTCRARNIGMMVVVQALSQLTAMHKDDAQTILNNCGYGVYFGTMDLETSKDLAQRLNIPLSEALSFSREKVAIFRRGFPPVTAKRFREDELMQDYKMSLSDRQQKYIKRIMNDTRKRPGRELYIFDD